MDRRERIKYLQIINRRKILLDKMREISNEILLDDFISLERTKELQNKVMTLMEKNKETKSEMVLPLQTSYKEIIAVAIEYGLTD